MQYTLIYKKLDSLCNGYEKPNQMLKYGKKAYQMTMQFETEEINLSVYSEFLNKLIDKKGEN